MRRDVAKYNDNLWVGVNTYISVFYQTNFFETNCQKNQFQKEQDACSGVNAACRAGIVIGFRQPRTIETY